MSEFNIPQPEASFALSGDGHPRVLILACGALAHEIMALFSQFPTMKIDLQCLPASLHNTPQLIAGRVAQKLTEIASRYDRVFLGYADCGTGGQLDRVLDDFPHVTRLVGAHCYATYTGQDEFDLLMQEELGSFFLTDYMVRQFDSLIIKGLGIDRFPQLRDSYFAHYKRVVYLAQSDNDGLRMHAELAAKKLNLAYEYRFTGMGELSNFIASAYDAGGQQK